MWGQVCLWAPLPAMMPICPPRTPINLLVGATHHWQIASDWQGGVMWSPAAITFRRFARKRFQVDDSPRIFSSPCISRLLRYRSTINCRYAPRPWEKYLSPMCSWSAMLPRHQDRPGFPRVCSNCQRSSQQASALWLHNQSSRLACCQKQHKTLSTSKYFSSVHRAKVNDFLLEKSSGAVNSRDCAVHRRAVVMRISW